MNLNATEEHFFIQRVLTGICTGVGIAVLAAAFFVSMVSVAVAAPAVEYDDRTILVQYRTGFVGVHADGRGYVPVTRRLTPSDSFVIAGADGAPMTFWKVTLKDNENVEEALAAFNNDPDVLVAEPNIIRRIALTSNDTGLAEQWHLVDPDAGIDPDLAWDVTTGSIDVVVAIVDTGVDLDHEDLAANMWVNADEVAGNGIDDDGNGYIDDVNGYDFVDADGNPTPTPNGLNDDGYADTDTGVTHGTHVSGITAAVGNNTVGVSGVAWTASIMAVRALDDEGSGTDAAIAEGIHYAVDNGAKIINMSLGAYGSTTVLEESVAYAVSNGVLVVSAAGNDGEDINASPFYPTCYDGVIGVAATDELSNAASFSNYGTNCVDVSAPGTSIYSTLYSDDPTYDFTEDYGYQSGTSMATPVVSGVAALVLSTNLTLTSSQLGDILVSTAEDIGLSAEYGVGRVNAYQAVTNTDIANMPSEPSSVTAYSTSGQNTEVDKSTRSRSQQPYFTWNGAADNSAIAGYYVYFGTDAAADPATEGTLQTEAEYQAPRIEGNSVSYYLLVSSVDDEGNVSLRPASFEYVIDTAIAKVKKVQTVFEPNGVAVSWKKLKNEGVSNYKILRRVGKKKFEEVGSVNADVVSYSDTAVRRGAVYEYRIKAVDDLQNVSRSKKALSAAFQPRERMVIAPGYAGGTVIGIYDVKRKRLTDSWYAYNATAAYGLELAVGNLDKDNRDEIVTGIAGDGGPEVRVFESNGERRSSFMAYTSTFTGGVRVAVGDFDNDGRDEIATVPGPGGSPQVKVFEMDGTQIASFNALNGGSSGAYIAGAQWDGKGADEIVVAPDTGNSASVSVYDSKTGVLITSFQPYVSGFSSGIRVAGAVIKKGKREAVLVIPPTGATRVEAFQKSGSSYTRIQPGFYGFVSTYLGGGTIGAGNFTQGLKDRLVVGSNGERQATIQIYTPTGNTLKDTIFPFVSSYTGPVNVANGWLK